MRLHYPGIELIADAEISADTDPYLKEHCFQGDQIFPAVLGMEAMAQVASALEETRPCAALSQSALQSAHRGSHG